MNVVEVVIREQTKYQGLYYKISNAILQDI